MDSVIAEIRKYRDELAARFKGDVRAILEDVNKRQSDAGRMLVSRPPRPVRGTVKRAG